MKVVVITCLLLLNPIFLKSQEKFKVKKVDNRFLFFKMGAVHDTIIKNKTDLFLIHFPDSLKHVMQIEIQNGRFARTKQDSIFKLMPIKGMKYSHTKIDTAFNTLLEGPCFGTNTVDIKIMNRKTNKVILHNHFIVK